MAEVTKRATKKALAEFCEANNLTDVKINNMLHTLYPNEFIETDEIAPIIIKDLFKKYDSITDKDVENYIKELYDTNKKLYPYKIVEIERQKKANALRNILESVIRDIEKGAVRASQYPEWNEDLKKYIYESYKHWSGVYDDNGKFAYGKVFYKIYSYNYYEYQNPPFHCYATKDGDVLFTRIRHKWIESKGCYDFETTSSNSGCLSMIMVVLVLLILSLASCENTKKQTNYDSVKQYNSQPLSPSQLRYIQDNIINRGRNTDHSLINALQKRTEEVINEYSQRPIQIRKTSPDDAYNEGYEEGYAQGRIDGSNGESHGYGYDDSNSYYDYYHTKYCTGYEEGYNDGYYSGLSEYEEEQEELEE